MPTSTTIDNQKELDNSCPSIPEAQQKLKSTLDKTFGDKITELPSHAWKEYGLSYEIAKENAKEIFKELKENQSFAFNMLIDVTAVDWMDRRTPRFDVVYQLLSLTYQTRVCFKIKASEEKPEVDSIVDLWPAANFLEREVWDMYGITFTGHPDLRRIMMYPEFVGHPLRKDYPLKGKQPRIPLRLPETRNTSADMHREELVAMPKKKTEKTETSNLGRS
jgi:NADH-quinone oxidoreductase subunit C